MANRLTQEAAEALLGNGTNPAARITQEATEALLGNGVNPAARVTQIAVEVLTRVAPDLQVSKANVYAALVTDPGLVVTKTQIYAVLEARLFVSKTNIYPVLTTPPGVVVTKAQVYAVLLPAPGAPEVVTLLAWVPNVLDQTMPPFNLPPQYSSDPSSPRDRRIAGVMDGVRSTFVLTTSEPVTEILLFWNGAFMTPGTDYTLSFNVITFITANKPLASDLLTAAVFKE